MKIAIQKIFEELGNSIQPFFRALFLLFLFFANFLIHFKVSFLTEGEISSAFLMCALANFMGIVPLAIWMACCAELADKKWRNEKSKNSGAEQ